MCAAHSQYVGRIFAAKSHRYADLIHLLLARAGLPEGTKLAIYEEVKFEPQLMCDLQPLSATLANAQLEDGDILCLQREPTEVLAPILCSHVLMDRISGACTLLSFVGLTWLPGAAVC